MSEPITEECVLNSVRKNVFRNYSWLTEVRSSLLRALGSRRADALAVSCDKKYESFSSLIEAKTSRSAWLNELSEPEKSEPFRRHCRFWWIVAPPLVVNPKEIQDGWGFIEVKNSKECNVIIDAEPHETEPLSWDLVSSVLKNQKDRESIRYSSGRMKGFEDANNAITNLRIELFKEKDKVSLLEVNNMMLKNLNNKLLLEINESIKSILKNEDHETDKAGR